MYTQENNYLLEETIFSTEALNNLSEGARLELQEAQKKLEMTKREKFATTHHPYKIYQQNTDNRWVTRLYDENSKKIKKICRVERDDLFKFLEEHYTTLKNSPTFSEVFHEYLEHHLKVNRICRSTYDRYLCTYNRFIKNTEYEKKKIKEIDDTYLDDMIESILYEHKINFKTFCRLRTILRQSFIFAKKRKYTTLSISNFFSDSDGWDKMFIEKDVDDDLEVYFDDEIFKIRDYIMQHPNNKKRLGILLSFNTGVRVGELVSIELEDIHDDCICINHTETYHSSDVKGKGEFNIKFPKSAAGKREVFLTESGKKIINMINELSPSSKYLFEKNGVRFHGKSINGELRKINELLGIPHKPTHKIRKTYATILFNSNVSDTTITKQLGHKELSTTMKYYVRQNKRRNQAQAEIKNALESYDLAL